MKLLFKQRFFSWLCSYDIYDESGNTVYSVEGQLSWGHCLKIFDSAGNEIGTVKERIQLFSFVPKFDIFIGNELVGTISKQFTFFKPVFDIDYNGWHVEGDYFEWDYDILDSRGEKIAAVSKELFNWTDTYVIDVTYPRDALCALMLVLAIDAEKCSRN